MGFGSMFFVKILGAQCAQKILTDELFSELIALKILSAKIVLWQA
jgi:hypothetical protein